MGRPAARVPGAHQPAHQCTQVLSGRERRAALGDSGRGRQRGAQREGQGRGHRSAEPPAHLRELPPGGRHAHAARGRHRARALHREAAGGAARRRHLARERAGPGQHLLRAPAARPGGDRGGREQHGHGGPLVKKVSPSTGGAPARAPLPRILYVEDEDENWELAQLWLEERFELVRAKDAESTCRAVRQAAGALRAVLMDIQLAGSALDGIQLTRLLRGALPREQLPPYALDLPRVDAPIFFVTAYGGRYRESELREAGGTRLLPKPVDFEALVRELEAAAAPR
ncbi:response regulator [Aggregicoccus sp. 17bor-14]|nr:response regulator [Aggregicoccus sp. 17bor-14]